MELRHLKYFIAVAETLNFRRAAERLNVAQPALSRQIKDLEDSISVQLLERDTGGTRLTEAGSVLLEEARDIMERIDMAREMARDAQAGRRGHLHIAGLGSMSLGLLSDTLAKFRVMYPSVDVSLHDIGHRDLISELRAGNVHLGFSFDPNILLTREFDSVHVVKSRARIAMSVRHPLAQEEAVSLKDFDDDHIFCIGKAGIYDLHRRITQSILSERSIHHKPLKYVANLELMMALLAGNYGVSLVFPRFFGETSQIVLKPILEDGDDLEIFLSAVWRRNLQPKLVNNFVEILRSVDLH
ncbi:LysR substrate-binding domain-containing protein [Coraliomargarita algicola]|uniref:LysR substrate-binding domain-containing protein n=1 Tax=Coraliomargarita algicola TaxID=3092156 RepID=A0ABZ0RM11_9BACT|nr:LysR substrate-binding domain-containing protein [Coraliomargarita sp. J2-16]WPJ96451.1 LysR substrate-binding domain-containing protein [Coraliomargarita sp. J2-16]